MNLLHSTSVRQCSESRSNLTPCGVADQNLGKNVWGHVDSPRTNVPSTSLLHSTSSTRQWRIEIDPPSLESRRSDFGRLYIAKEWERKCLRGMSTHLEQCNFQESSPLLFFGSMWRILIRCGESPSRHWKTVAV